MYAELDVMTKVKSILSLVTALSQTNKKLKKAKNDEERRELKTAYNKYKELFTKRLHEELRLSETYKKYLEIQ